MQAGKAAADTLWNAPVMKSKAQGVCVEVPVSFHLRVSRWLCGGNRLHSPALPPQVLEILLSAEHFSAELCAGATNPSSGPLVTHGVFMTSGILGFFSFHLPGLAYSASVSPKATFSIAKICCGCAWFAPHAPPKML